MTYCSRPYSGALRKTIFSRQETYLGDSRGSTARGAADFSPMFDTRGAVTGGDCADGTDGGPTQEVSASVMTMMGSSQRGSTWEESGAVPIREAPPQMEVVATDASLGTERAHANEVGPRSEDGTSGHVSAPWSLGVTVPLAVELGLLGYPCMSFLLASWRRVESCMELACS
jgi:hypothetical protein